MERLTNMRTNGEIFNKEEAEHWDEIQKELV